MDHQNTPNSVDHSGPSAHQVASDRTGGDRPPKYIVRSTFGSSRARGSRKNRPCDACRRRKTACIILSDPPCRFCRSRNIPCLAALAAEGPFGARSQQEHLSVGSPPPPGVGPLLISPATTEGAQNPQQHNTEPSVPTRSLETSNGRCTYYIGPAAEQDSMLLGAFRYDILNEFHGVDANVFPVHLGTQDINDRPINFLSLTIGHTDAANQARQAASDSIELMVRPHGEHLVRLYFHHIHPVLPIVPKLQFLQNYASNRENVPACLRGAIYGLASTFWTQDGSIGEPCPFQECEVLDHAHAALRREIENPTLQSLAACLLLIHATAPAIDIIEEPTTWTMSAQATAVAQLLGLHQEPGAWSIPPDEKKLRRMLWWAVYATDCWSAVCYGNPPHIGPGSFNTMSLDLDDLQCGEAVPGDLRHLVHHANAQFDVSVGARFLETVMLSRRLRDILDSSLYVPPTCLLDRRVTAFYATVTLTVGMRCSKVYPKGAEVPDRTVIEAQLRSVHTELRHWAHLSPSCLMLRRPALDSASSSYNCPVHLNLYATKVLLYRALMHPATYEAKNNPHSNLQMWFSEALAEFESFAQFLSQITPGDLNGFWGRHARSQFTSCANFLIYLFLMASEHNNVERAYRLLESFIASTQALKSVGTAAANAFLRPAALRVQSFFLQAEEIIGRKHS